MQRGSCAPFQPAPVSAHALLALGFSVRSYATVTLALLLLSAAGCFVVAGIIGWRKSNDGMALLAALALAAGGTQVVAYLVEAGSSPWQVPAFLVTTLDFVLLFLLFTPFPSERFVPS
jgi:hypothetical protein